MENPPIPFVGPIHGGFSDGKMVRIQGYTAPIADRFNVNLQCGPEETDDIALHVSVRLTEGYVARNSFKGGEWGDEQGDGDLPIGPSQKFEIIILCATNDYKIAINGRHFCEFPQRLSPSSVTHLAINGDISLSLISFEGGENRSSASSQESSRQFGQQNQYGQYGPPGQFGPQGQYGPPQGGQYGPPQGGPYGGYGAPPPPPGQQEKDSGFDFLGTASSVIAGAISSGMADKLIGSLTSGGNSQQSQHPQQQYQQQPQYQQNPPQQQPNFGIPQLGGQGSLGGLGSVGSLLSGFAEQILQPKKEGHH